MAYIKAQIQKIAIEKKINLVFEDIFLLPTNPSFCEPENAKNGDVEILLFDIKSERYQLFMNCYEAFCKCAEDFSTHKMTDYKKVKT